MKLKQFDKQQFLTIETFRKNGQGVKTPVWFAQDGETLHVWTQADSGKVKRIRNSGAIRVTPSTATGESVGEWVNAQASANDAPEKVAHTEKLFRKKYGLVFLLLSAFNKWRGGAYTSVEIRVTAPLPPTATARHWCKCA